MLNGSQISSVYGQTVASARSKSLFQSSMQMGRESVMTPNTTHRPGYEEMLDPLIEEKGDRLRQIMDPRIIQESDKQVMIKSKKQRTKYRLNDLYPGLAEKKDDMTFESGVAVNIASSLKTVSRLNNKIDMSPTMKAKTKLN